MDDYVDYSKKAKATPASRASSRQSARVPVPSYEGDEQDLEPEADNKSYRSKRSTKSKRRSRSKSAPSAQVNGESEDEAGGGQDELETMVLARVKSGRSLRSVKREPVEDSPIMVSPSPPTGSREMRLIASLHRHSTLSCRTRRLSSTTPSGG